MFIAAFLISIVWMWFQYGFEAAILFSVIGLLALVYSLRWRVAYVAGAVAWLLFSLEFNFNHVLTRAYQHQVIPLTLCLIQTPKIFADGFVAGYAKVTKQPDYLNIRHVKISISEKLAKSSDPLLAGDCIDADVRLRQPVGRIVPGAFNADRYNFSQKIDAYGSIVLVRAVKSSPDFAQKMYLAKSTIFETTSARDMWAALALGWSYSMSSELKAMLAANQLMHLFVISGMHLAFIGLLVGLIVQGFSTVISSVVVVNYKTKMLVVLLTLLLYVGLIGYPIPALRAFLMMLVPVLSFWFGVKINWYRSFVVAVIVITLWSPESWLSIGPWLSFSAVGLILLINHWRLLSKFNWVSSVLIFQVFMSMSILPWALISGFKINLFSFIINLVLTPLVAIIGLPLVFLIAITHWSWPIELFTWCVTQLIGLLPFFTGFSFELPFVTPVYVFILIGLVFFVCWNRHVELTITSLIVALILSCIVIFRSKQMLVENDVVTLFDVGHGQAVLFETKESNILYDTGGQFTDNISFLEASLDRVLPSLDAVIVSHSDSDHSNGFKYLAQQQPKMSVWSSQMGIFSGEKIMTNCHRKKFPYTQFSFLLIPDSLQANDNDHSCILVFQSGNRRMILTGDASRTLEYFIIQKHSDLMPFDIVLLGHHGSDSSSAIDWLNMHKQAMFLISSGDRASPKWPSERILQWFNRKKIIPLNTAKLGTIRLTFLPDRIAVKTWDSAYRIRLIN